ncbi:MAG: hypothetical protein KF748_01210 [Xanthobacteraceae bacterium]|nr:hypothetical protein [Xanthobacteraceae bacterium]
MIKTELPYWLQVFSALAVPAIAILGLGIAFAQWRTAQQKTVMELFEKRWRIWDGLRKAIVPILKSGMVSDEDWKAFLRARDGDSFLFGKEVTSYLDAIHKELLNHQAAESMSQISELDRAQQVGAKTKAFRKIAAFFEEFPPLIEPYMRMHQQSPSPLNLRLWPRK